MKLLAPQKGFTLVETLIGLALIAVIAAVTTSVTVQIFKVQADNVAHITALRQAENGIHWLAKDMKQAQRITMDGTSGFPLELEWQDWGSAGNCTSYYITYSLNDGALMRYYNAGQIESSTVVARDVSLVGCELFDTVYSITLAVTSGGARPATETRKIEVFPSSAVDR